MQGDSQNSLLRMTQSRLMESSIRPEQIELHQRFRSIHDRQQEHIGESRIQNQSKQQGFRVKMMNILRPKRGEEQGKSHIHRRTNPQRSSEKEAIKRQKLKFKTQRGSMHKQSPKEAASLGDILNYYLNDYLQDSKPQLQFYETWEVEQLRKQITSLSLGLFVIRLPNPDNPDEQVLKYYTNNRVEDSDKYVVTPSEALNLYEQMFVMDSETNINLAQKEKAAFCLAYYLLELPEITLKDLMRSSKFRDEAAMVEDFVILFAYYRKIKYRTVDEYQLLRKTDFHVTDAEYKLPKSLPTQIPHLFRQGQTQKANEQFSKIKSIVHSHLWNILLDQLKGNYGQKLSLLRLVLACSERIGDIFNEFPELVEKIILYLTEDQNVKQNERMLCGGGQLRRVPQKDTIDQFMWENRQGRPKDLLTLMRNMLLYKLTLRANLFVRQFLLRDEKSIILVVDSSEETLEKYAQSNGVLMEVDMGAIDLFSFEPVDSYNRPLRLNSYIRDRPFYEKYQLGINKGEKDYLHGIKSVESDLTSYYTKATKLNRDELRVKVILDQEDLDNAYRWISERLNIDYIEPQAILVNSKNDADVDETLWEVYYIYTKLVLQYHRRIKSTVERSKQQPEIYQELLDNLGLTYRLAFCKAMQVCNDIYDKYTTNTFFKKVASAVFGSKLKLKNIWDQLGYTEPTAYCEYFKKKRLERIWRKYQINEKRTRSKFVSSQRIHLGNRIIQSCINMAQGQSVRLISEYFPLHDPYLLKGIKIQPYLKVFVDQGIMPRIKSSQEEMHVSDIMMQFEGKRCASDFTRQSVEEKLEFKILRPSKYEDLSIETIKNYSGEKIALFFQFIKFVTGSVKFMFIASFIVQILLWVENNQIIASGSSTLTPTNNVILFIFSLLNIGWTTHLVERWRQQEKNFQQKFGLSNLTEEEEKSNLFKGHFMRNMENDNLNYEYAPVWKKILKVIYSSLVSVVYAMVVVTTVLMIFILKGYLIETSASQITADAVPAIIVTIMTQLYNYAYKKLSKRLTEFENHKTLSQFEESIIFKQYTIIFVNTFSALFIYAFLDGVFPQVRFCQTKTSLNTFVSNCSLQVSNQMLALCLISFLFDIIKALWPYLKFKVKEFLTQRKNNTTKTTFSLNHFEAIDQFFEEQRSMQSFMYNQEVDNTAMNYTDFVVRFTALMLFGPSLPFAYCLMYFNGVVALHTNKFEILMLSQRTMPVKTKSIGIWSNIIEIIGFLGVIVNLCYVIYTRELVTIHQAQLLLGSVIVLFLLKFYLTIVYSQPTTATLVLEQRNERNIHKSLLGVKRLQSSYIGQEINTDISNVDYTEVDKRRKLPELAKANVRTR